MLLVALLSYGEQWSDHEEILITHFELLSCNSLITVKLALLGGRVWSTVQHKVLGRSAHC